MPKINSNTPSYLNQPCNRCGSKKRIAKTWTQEITTYTRTQQIEHTLILCTNEVCQADFDNQRNIENQKRELMKANKEASNSAKRANAILRASQEKKAN